MPRGVPGAGDAAWGLVARPGTPTSVVPRGGFWPRGWRLPSVSVRAQTARSRGIAGWEPQGLAGREINNGKANRDQVWGKPYIPHVDETI